jgi:hypothetical protein
MFEGSIIGALRFILGADTAELDAAGPRASKALRKAAKDGEAAGKAIAGAIDNLYGRLTRLLGISGLVAAAIRVFQNAVADMRALDRLSTATGTGIAQLQSLRAVAERVGVDFNRLSGVLEQHGMRMREALANPTSDAALALNMLGVNARNADGSLRTFDELLPSLADALNRYADGANKSAIVSRLFGEAGGPEMARLLAQGSAEIQRQRREYEATNKAFSAEQVRDFTTAQANLTDAFRRLSQELAIMATGPAKSVIDALVSVISYINQAAGAAMPRAAQVMEQLQAELQTLADLQAQVARGGIVAWATGAERTLADVNARVIALRAELAALVAADAAAAKRRNEGRPQAPDPDAARKAMEQARFELQEFLTIVSGQGTLIETMNVAWMTHAEIIEEVQRRIRAAYGQTAEAHRALATATRQLNTQFESGIKTVMGTAAQTLTALFPKSKGAAIAAAMLQMGVAIMNAMALPFPLNWVQVGLVAAQGAATIANMKSVTSSGGGSIPGTNIVGNTSEAPAMPTQAVTINIPGGQVFSSEMLASFVGQLNEYVKNGATLVATVVK